MYAVVRTWTAFVFLAAVMGRGWGQQAGRSEIFLQVKPAVAGARIRVTGPRASATAVTDAAGSARVRVAPPGPYRLRVEAAGYQTLERELALELEGTAEVELPLLPVETQTVTVEAQGIAPTTQTVTGEDAKQSALQPGTVRDALPLVPGIVRTAEGKLRISDTPEHQSALMVNSVDVTDPATGQFGATIPIDAVAAIDVFKSPFLAEYGRFSSAVVAVETRRAADKWRFELNDPTPEMRIRSAHIVGIRGFTPRVAVSGPVIANKLFFSETTELRIMKTPVFALGFPNNEERRQSVNSLTQFDWIASPTHFFTLTLHGVPQRAENLGLSFYNPLRTTPDYRGHEYRPSLSHTWTHNRTVVNSSLSAGETSADIWPKGPGLFTLTPTVNDGDYFLGQHRRARRYQLVETLGTSTAHHAWKFGGVATHTRLAGSLAAQGIRVEDGLGATLQRIDFVNQPPYLLSDVETAAFVQDHYTPLPHVSLDAGLRMDYQRLSGVARFAPRLGAAWSPFGDSGTVFRSGMGFFYDRVPLTVFAFGNYPERVVDGQALRNEVPNVGLAPRNLTWSSEIDQRLFGSFRVRAIYRNSRATRLVTLNPAPGALQLTDAGRFHQHQFELVTRTALRKSGQVVVSYTRQASVSNMNDFAEFLGDVPAPIVRPDVRATAPGNVPHRLLAWGMIPVVGTWQVAPVMEWRSGFPWSPVDAAQQYVGLPNSERMPRFLSLDLRVSKQVKLPRGHAARLAFSVFNVTNHFNPDTVRWNVADPQFGQLLGQHPRRYRVDFDFLF